MSDHPNTGKPNGGSSAFKAMQVNGTAGFTRGSGPGTVIRLRM
jgi:hypothetical protein